MDNIIYIIGFLILGLAALAIYFLPSIIARKNRNLKKIFFLNLLGAWTGIFWVVALLWAIFSDDINSIRDERKERIILAFAEKKGGKITAMELSAETNFSLEEAKKELHELYKKGFAELEVTGEGNLLYVFEGFISNREKAGSRSPLDF